VIYLDVCHYVTLNGYYDAQCNDIIQIFPIQTVTEATWDSMKGNCLWYGAMTQSKTYTDIYSCGRNCPFHITTIGYHVSLTLVT